MDTVTTQIADSVEALSERIAALVSERQALRATAAAAVALEQNRLEIARLQQRLSVALIQRHRPAAA
jgi:regulator of replication initiation timing